MDKVVEKGGGEKAADIGKPLEARHEREAVLNAFNNAFTRFEKAYNNNELNDQQKWAFESLKNAKEKTDFAKGKDTYTNEFFKDPKNPVEKISQEEGIPTEELLALLSKEAENFEKYPLESQARKDLIREAHILYKQSKRYSQVHEVSGPVHNARLHHEANLISKDVRQTGSELGDWVKAENTLLSRLELVLPEASETKTAEETVKPAEEVAPEAAEVASDAIESKPEVAEKPAEEAPASETAKPTEEPVEEVSKPSAPFEEEKPIEKIFLNVGAQNEDIRKLNERQAEMRIQERLMERFPTSLPQNRILRVGRLIAHTLNPKNWGKILFNNSKEYYRQIWMQEHYDELKVANFGATNTLSKEAANRAMQLLKERRTAGKAVVERAALGEKGILEGEKILEGEEVSGEFRNYILNDILKPTVSELSGQTPNDERLNEIENGIQQKLFDYVSKHQQGQKDSDQIKEFFGQNSSQYGNLSEFYASDILETARKLVADKKAHQLATGRLDDYIQLRLFRARWAEATEARYNLADNLMKWSQQHRRLGKLINPATAGITASAVTFLITKPTLGLRAASLATPITGLATGMAFAGLRRNWDLKQQYKEVARRAETGQRAKPGTGGQVEKLQEYLPDMATDKELIEGGGQELAGKQPRKSISELLSAKLQPQGGESAEEIQQITATREALGRRFGEIEARLNFPVHPQNVHRFLFFGERSIPEGVGLISYESRASMEHGKLELVKNLIEIKQALTEKANMTPEDLRSYVSLWNQKFIQNREMQNRAFARYRLGQSLESAVGAGIIGGGLGLGFQEVGALVFRAAGHTVGQTLVEKGINFGAQQLGQPEVIAPSPSVETFREAAASGTPQDFRQGPLEISLRGHTASVTNLADNKTFNSILDANGRLTVNAGTLDRADLENVRTSFAQNHFETSAITDSPTEAPSNLDEFKDVLAKKTTKVFTFKDFNATVDGASQQVTIQDFKTGQSFTVPVDNNGELTFDGTKIPKNALPVLKERLEQAGFTTQGTHVLSGETKTVTKDVLEHFRTRGELEKAQRILWHDNDTPMHLNEKGVLVGADGKELQFYHHASKDGAVDLDMSQMVSNLTPRGWENWDFTIDNQYNRLVKDVITNPDGSRTYRNFEFLITPNDAADKTREVIRATVNSNGHLQLPKGSELSQFFEIKDGKVVQLARFVEVAHVEKDASGNMIGRTILSTSVGHGMDNIVTTTTTPGVDILKATPSVVHPVEHHYSFEADPPAEEYIPITPAPEIAPIPLEPLGPSILPPEIPLPMYYGGESLESLRNWLRANPNRLHPYKKVNNPDGTVTWLDEKNMPVQRSVDRERQQIEQYLNEIKTSNPQYYSFIENLTKDSTIASMSNENRVSINIPAWMEGKNIYNVLDKYVGQVDENGNPLNPNLYEINIIVNRKTGTPPDNTVSEIQRFIADKKARGKNYNINFVDVEFDPPFNNVGHARKVITDLTLMRSLKRSSQSKPLYIESEDADLLHVDPKTAINLINKLDSNPHLDAVRGIQDRFPEELMKNDFLFISRRLWDYTENFLRRRRFRPENNPNWNFTWHRIITGGWNTGYTAEAYALIDGYDSLQTKGEDMTIGEKATMIRGDGAMPNLDVVGKVPTHSDSSPRRFIAEMITGKGAYTESFEDESLNEFIKNATLEELQQKTSSYARIDEFNKGTFAGMFKGHLKSIRNLTPDENAAREIFNSVMFWMGFKKGDYAYKPDGEIEITNWSNLQTALNNYRANHPVGRQKGQRTRRKTTKTVEATAPAPPPPAPPPPPTTETLNAEMKTEEKSAVAGIGFSEDANLRHRPSMEDNHTIVENFGNKPNQSFFAIYDGHGGKEAADSAAKLLHTFLKTDLTLGLSSTEALRDAFIQADRAIVATGSNAGATAITALVQGNKLTIANAGDARAVLNRNGKALRLSHDHKATDPDEIERVKSVGGFIKDGRVNGIIAVARSLGDRSLKPSVSAAPYVSDLELKAGDNSLILACDGVFDVISDQEAISIIASEADPQKASETLKQEALRRGSNDNISVMVIKLKP